MQPNELIPGGLFHASVEGGRAGCDITVGAAGLRAKTTAGAVFELRFASMQVEMGGASGRMLFCRPPERDLTIFSEDPRLPGAIKAVAPRPLVDALGALTQRRSRQQLFRYASGLAFIALIVGGVVAAPSLLRATANALVARLPYEVDQKLGELASADGGFGAPSLEDEQITDAVEAIVARLAPEAKKLAPQLPLTFDVRVVQSPELNAFALPGGHLVIYTGLIAAAERPEQLAGVVAHEMSHVFRRHGLQRISQSLGVVAAMQLLLGDASGLVGAGRDLLTVVAVNDYSREQEAQADADAVTMMLDAGLDARALAELFVIMQQQAASGLPALTSIPWLGTHPEFDARVAAIERQAGPSKGASSPLPADWVRVHEAVKRHGATAAEK